MEKITSDMKLIKVLASEARREDVPEDQVQEAADIMAELAAEMTPENRYQLAQVMAYTIDELQQIRAGDIQFFQICIIAFDLRCHGRFRCYRWLR